MNTQSLSHRLPTLDHALERAADAERIQRALELALAVALLALPMLLGVPS